MGYFSLYLWQSIEQSLLSLCIKPRHLKWIMRLQERHYIIRRNNIISMWTGFIFSQFVAHIKDSSLTKLECDCDYGYWVSLNILLHRDLFQTLHRSYVKDSVNYFNGSL